MNTQQRANLNLNNNILNKHLDEDLRKINFLNESVGYIDIPKFFTYVKNLNQGEIYRVINTSQKIIDDKWEITYLRNSNKNFRNFMKYFKKIGINAKTIHNMEEVEKLNNRSKFKAGCSRHRGPQAQSLDDIFNFPSQVNAAIHGINNVLPTLNEAAIGISHVTTSITSMVNFVNDIFSQWKTTMLNATELLSSNMYNIMEYIVKLTALAYLVAQPHNQNLSNAVALLTLILPSTVTGGILPFAEGLIRVIKGMSGAQSQAEDDDGGFIKSFFQLTVGITKGLFGEVPKDVFDSLNISSRKVKLISDYIRGTTTIVDCLTRIFSKVIEFIGDGILKYFGFIPSFMKEETLTPLVDEFLNIKLERLDVQCTIQVDAARKVVSLYEKLLKYESKLNKDFKNNGGNINFKQAPYIRIMIKTLEGCINRIPDHLRTGLTPRRIKPFWIYLYGDPRIGKTAVLQPHLVNALSLALKLINKYEDYTNYTYLRNCGEDYWEGYDNHPVLWYNDIFQNFAQEEKMHQAIMELTNIVDDNVYPLEMAFERKHCVYFSSQVVISNAQHDIINAGFIQNKCWSGGQHLFARRNICLKLSLNEKYAAKHPNVGIDYVEMQKEIALHPHLCVGYEACVEHTPDEYASKLLFPNDMYIMSFTEPSTGALLMTTDYPNGIAYVCQQALAYKKSQSAFKDKLYDHFERMWAQSDDEPEMSTWVDARLATESEWVEAVMSNVFRELEEAVPGLVNSGVSYNQYAAKWDDGKLDYLAQFYAENRDNGHNAYARVNVAIELAGAHYFMSQNNSFWKKFCQRTKHWVAELWANFKSSISNAVTTLGPFAPVLAFAIGLYGYYRFIILYTKFWNLILGPKVVYLKEGERFDVNNCASTCLPLNAQSHESKLKPPTPQILRVPKRVGVAQSYDQQNTIVENIVNKQMCKFTIRVYQNNIEAHSRRFGSGICLGSDIFLVPYHFWFRWFEMKDYWESNGCVVKLCLQWNEVLEVVLDWSALMLCRLQYSHTEDLAYFRIKHLVQKPHIKKFFISSNDRPVLSTLYVYGRRALSFDLTTMGVTDGEYKLTVYEHQSKDDPLYGGKFAQREICIPIALHYYNCCTTAGDCGTLIMHCDSSLNCKKVLAMHTAGHVAEGYGIGSLIFQEDIDEVFNYFYPDGFNIAPVAMEFDEVEDLVDLKSLGLQVLGKLPKLTVPEYEIDRYPVLMMPRKSKISHSIVYDVMEEDFGPSTVLTAHLRPFELDGIKQSPLYLALKKMAIVSPMPDTIVADDISQHMFETFACWKSTVEPRVFTNCEMINGSGLMNAIEMSTSAGYPYVILNNTSGKHPFFNKISLTPIVYEANSYLSAQLYEREQQAMLGKIVPTYFIDTLKDETRPIDKVKQGKTRLFQISPLDFNLLLRKYFGAFLCHTQETFIVGESAVGINANSTEWTLMVQNLMSVGDNFINGDGKNFDASASQPIAMYNVCAINKWYKLGKDWKYEHDCIRKTLWATFLNSWHIVRNVVYTAFQGNKSGTAVTTQFNNLIGMFAIRWSYLLAGYTLHTFHNSIKPKFYGDDDLICVNTVLSPKVTCEHHKQTMKRMGIEYTSATKDEVVSTWYNITQISFLKRRFVWDGIRYLPQLDYSVIFEIARWSESNPENMVDQMNRFNSSLLELSNYGRKAFEVLRDKYVEYTILIKRRGLVISPTSLFSFDYCEYIKWGDLYKPAQLIIDRINASDVAKIVQYESAANDVKLSPSKDIFGLSSLENTQTANAQTHESKNLPPKAQIVRINRPKAQGEEDKAKDFELYLTLIDHLREMKPTFNELERATIRQLNLPMTDERLVDLKQKVQELVNSYSECVTTIKHGPKAQGEEFVKARAMLHQSGNEHVLNDVDESLHSSRVTQQRTTTFVNDAPTHQPPVPTRPIPSPCNSNVSTDMELYFKRPTIIDSFSWTSTDVIWSTKGEWWFPYHYLKIPEIGAKLAMVMYARPDFEFEIVCNSTPFHYGRLLFVVMPFHRDGTGIIPKCYDSPFNATTWPHWYQISAGSKQTVKFTVPYRHVYSQCKLNTVDPMERFYFTIKCYVSVPLYSANSATAGPVQVTIYGAMKEPRLSGNTWTGALAQGEDVALSKQKLVVNNPVSDTPQRVVSAALDGVARVTKDMSQLAYDAGFSTPVNLGATNAMQVRQPLMNKMNDLPNSVKLGGDMQARLSCNPEYVNSESDDDMNISYIVASPCLLETFALNSSDYIGKLAWSHYLTPRSMTVGGLGTVVDPNTDYYLPVGYISKFFNYWRGGWKLHFAAVCSSFHSVRLRISYIPASTGTTIATPAQNIIGSRAMAFTRNVVWDVSKNTELTLRFPFETNTHWRHTDTQEQDALGGLVTVHVMNPLTSATASATTQPIYIQVFASAGDDFQFAHPARRAQGTNRQWAPDLAVSQAEEECTLPSSSSTCLRQQKGLLMGDEDCRSRRYHDSMATTYTSLKQLVNQLTPIDWFQSTTTDTKNIHGRRYTPYGTEWNDPWDHSFWLTPMHCIIPMFRFARGGFRMYMFANKDLQIGALTTSLADRIPVYAAHDTDVLNGMDTEAEPLGTASYGFAHFYDSALYPADVTVPYHHVQPCILTNNGACFDTDMIPSVQMSISTQKSLANIMVCVAGADDFMLGYRMSIPRIRRAAATLKVMPPIITPVPQLLKSTASVLSKLNKVSEETTDESDTDSQ